MTGVPNAGSTLAHHRRWRASIKTALGDLSTLLSCRQLCQIVCNLFIEKLLFLEISWIISTHS